MAVVSPMEKTGQPFYLIHTHAGKEETAVQNLLNQEIEAWHLCDQIRRKNGSKFKNVERPYFPRYVFARFDMDRLFSPVRNTRGVASIIRFGEEFATVDESVIFELMTIPGTDSKQMTASQAFAVDEVVKIISGGWIGWTGRIASIAKDGNLNILIPGASFGKDVIVSHPELAVSAA